MTTTLPLTWSPLRVEAERLAREWYSLTLVDSDEGWTNIRELHEVKMHMHDRRCLLADLTRPESRDLWIRWALANDKRWRPFYDNENEDWVAVGPDPENPADLEWYWAEGCGSVGCAEGYAEHWCHQWWEGFRLEDRPEELLKGLAELDAELAKLMENAR